ncbi:MAG: hypothetical protein LBM94_04370 [Propionibacteriaceae bacterium]|nr:hypothetical protein [Propionibacteriaceae bacterium]
MAAAASPFERTMRGSRRVLRKLLTHGVSETISGVLGIVIGWALNDNRWAFAAIALLVLVLVIVLTVMGYQYIQVRHDKPGEIVNEMSQSELEEIHAVVAVVSRLEDPGDRPIQNLIRHLPNLAAVYVIKCKDDTDQLVKLQDWLTSNVSQQVDIFPVPWEFSRHSVSSEDLQVLATFLREFAAKKYGAGLYVDVTADTKATTILLSKAASVVGLPVTFIGSPDPLHPSKTFSLIRIDV